LSDELRRRFRDKIQSRPVHGRKVVPQAEPRADGAQDPFRVHALDHGLFPGVEVLSASFAPGGMRVRLTLDLAEEVRGRRPLLGAAESRRLLGLCPSLPEHACQDPALLPLVRPGQAARAASATSESAEGDGLAIVHLIEHMAIDLISAATGAARCGGIACSYRDRPGRFDLFVECAEPMMGRAAAILASAAVRDAVLGIDRLAIHLRCRELLVALGAGGRPRIVAEDVAEDLGWSLREAHAALEAVVRLGYLEPLPGAFTFSSATGTIFRRAFPEAPALR
jgi:hypothetical protein